MTRRTVAATLARRRLYTLLPATNLFVRFDGKVYVAQDQGEGGVVGVAEPLGPDGAVRGPVLRRVLRLVVALRL